MYSLRDEYNSRLEGMYNILESSDIVTEFLSLKKKNKKVKQEYEIKMVESKIRKISAEINSFIRSNKEISKLINHGLRIYPYNEIYEAVRKRDKTETHYYSNTHFQFVIRDLSKYTKNYDQDKAHPIEKPYYDIMDKLEEIVDKNHDIFKVVEYAIDFDIGKIYLKLK